MIHNLCQSASPLNFRVLGAAAAPAAPAEHTIWVETESEINGWAFSAAEPESPAEGLVWFRISDLGPVPFNALKKNTLQVFPVGCQQYTEGAWVKKTAKTYQNGAWLDWVHPLYWRGQQPYTLEITNDQGASISFGETDFTITDAKKSSDYSSRFCYTDCQIPGSWNALCMSLLACETVDVGLVSDPTYTANLTGALAYLSMTSPGIHRLDLSGVNTLSYLQFAIKNGSATFDKIWLEA